MNVYLMFSPTRTREYSRSPFDLGYDFFVKFTQLEAVCVTSDATVPVGQLIIESLKDDCKLWREAAYQISNDFMIWKNYMPSAWNEAIGVVVSQLNNRRDAELSTKVFVAMKKRPFQIWGGASFYDQLDVIGVWSEKRSADVSAKGENCFVVEMPLIGVPATV